MEGMITHGGLSVEYRVYGDGPVTWLCFHGFGRTAADFEVFLPLLSRGERMICIHLFGHGRSVFPADRLLRDPLRQEEWRFLVLALLQEWKVDRFSLLGYSMGGRVAMVTCLSLADRVDRMLLLAPDGLKRNRLYMFASGTAAGRALYRSIIRNPAWLFRAARVLNRIGLLSDKLYRFVHVHLDSREKREQVYYCWLTYRRMFPDLRMLAREIRRTGMPVHFLFGQYDSIIPLRLGQRFARMLGRVGMIHAVALGHRLMDPVSIKHIAECGLWISPLPTGGGAATYSE
ncbi:MAG: alpha/beta fold hydrolase [Flavobacteriales bacterium]|jgi:pimeloyl-ACP methyl ester carboxylesterase